MAEGRNPKRQRKKEAARAKRQARAEAAARAKRRRRMLTIATLAILAVAGGAAAFFMTRPEATDVAASPSPDASPDASPDGSPAPAADCNTEAPETAEEEKASYEEAEDQNLDPENTYIWRLHTSCGQIDIELAVEQSPQTANSVAFLTREGFYDGLTFHRVVGGFVVQGGDPEGQGTGGSGYQVVEAPPEDISYTEGVVAMAKAQNDPPGASGSQFFIVTGADVGLPPEYAYVGDVVGGMDVAKAIESFAQEDQTPSQTIWIESAEIVEQ